MKIVVSYSLLRVKRAFQLVFVRLLEEQAKATSDSHEAFKRISSEKVNCSV